MKNLLALLTVSLLVISGSGCIKPTTGTTVTTSSGALDVTGFALSAPKTYIPGSKLNVDVSAPKIPNGTYTLYYSIITQGGGSGTSGSSSVTFTNGKSSFTTVTLLSSYGCMDITVNSIQTTTNNYATAISNASTPSCDSSGVMDATYNSSKFYTTDLSASLNGSTLQISGTVYDGPSYYSQGKTIQLTMQHFSQSPKTVTFTASDYWDKGYASYSSSTNNQNAAYGTISVTATSPILSGSFSFTTQDSSKFSGTFKVIAP